MTRSIGEMLILTCIAIVLGLLVNMVSPAGIPLFGNWNPDKGSINAGGPCLPANEEISESSVLAAYLDSNTLFVDARTEEDYIAGHIPRAVSFPYEQFDDLYPVFLDQYSPDQKMITYCSGLECHDSHDLAEDFISIGFTDVVVYARGYEGWLAENRPIKEGSEP